MVCRPFISDVRADSSARVNGESQVRTEHLTSNSGRATALILVSSASRFFHKRCNESSIAQADGASTSAVRPVIRNAVQYSIWFHFRRTGQARATACASTVSHDAFLITPPSGPPSPPVEVDLRASAVLSSSECLFSGGDDALTTHFLALTHHAWPNHYSLRCHNQILNDQILNDSAAAAPPQRPELGSSTDAAKPRVAAVATVAAAPKPHRPWLNVPSFAVGSFNRLASMLRAVSSVVNRRASNYRRGTYSERLHCLRLHCLAMFSWVSKWFCSSDLLSGHRTKLRARRGASTEHGAAAHASPCSSRRLDCAQCSAPLAAALSGAPGIPAATAETLLSVHSHSEGSQVAGLGKRRRNRGLGRAHASEVLQAAARSP